MNKMTSIRFHGRGGQGTVTAAELLAKAAFHEGKHSQAFPSFGVERRGAPVEAFCRVSDEKIRLREQIYFPDYLIIQDPTLIGADSPVLNGIKNCKGILINSEKSAFAKATADASRNKNVVAVHATKIALEKIGKPFINTALLGAFASMSKIVSLEALEKAIKEMFKPELAGPNIEAMKEAYKSIN
ncbi:MAG: pyruvate ferredoxin oxidoreductase subunit gamma [Parcubacteria group bacterium]